VRLLLTLDIPTLHYIAILFSNLQTHNNENFLLGAISGTLMYKILLGYVWRMDFGEFWNVGLYSNTYLRNWLGEVLQIRLYEQLIILELFAVSILFL
jgi:hypothetical protein